MKRNDIIIIIALLGIAGLFYISQQFMTQNREELPQYVSIYLDGNLYNEFDISVPNTIRINTEEGYNLIKIMDRQVFMVEADCHAQVCVRSRAIHKIGESIVCLPHKLYITIQGERQDIDAITD